MYRVKIDITLKKSVLDPQGKTTLQALHSMKFHEAKDLRIGKFFDLVLDTPDEKTAQNKAHEMCKMLFVNPVIEDYEFTIEEV